MNISVDIHTFLGRQALCSIGPEHVQWSVGPTVDGLQSENGLDAADLPDDSERGDENAGMLKQPDEVNTENVDHHTPLRFIMNDFV